MDKLKKTAIFILIGAIAGFFAPSAKAAVGCDFKSVYAAYQTAKKAPDGAGLLKPLADLGFPPALTALAQKTPNPVEAATLATVAGKYWDGEGTALSQKLLDGLNQEQKMAALKNAQDWKPNLSACPAAKPDKPKAVSRTSFAYGSHVITFDSRTPKKMAAGALASVRNALDEIATLPQGPVLSSLAEELEIRMTDRYNRYVGWQKSTGKEALVVSASFLLDQDPKFLTQAIAQELVRKSYALMPDSSLADPYVQMVEGKRLVGSIYTDIKNKKFFDTVKKSLEMAKSLPDDLRKNLDAVDEIRYNPASKFFAKGGGIDGTVAYYNRTLSSAKSRLIFIRRKMLWSSPLDTLLSLVHEGNHALQHETAERYYYHIKQGKGDKAMSTYVDTWNYKGKAQAAASRFVRKFECEATLTEIAVARHFDASPDAIEGSQYLKVCDDAQRALIAWKNSRFKKSRLN